MITGFFREGGKPSVRSSFARAVIRGRNAGRHFLMTGSNSQVELLIDMMVCLTSFCVAG
jgi:hypothetical protein